MCDDVWQFQFGEKLFSVIAWIPHFIGSDATLPRARNGAPKNFCRLKGSSNNFLWTGAKWDGAQQWSCKNFGEAEAELNDF